MKQTAEYVQRAMEAEARISELEDEALKRQWRDVAVAYRNLAQARLLFTTSETASRQALPSQTFQASPQK